MARGYTTFSRLNQNFKIKFGNEFLIQLYLQYYLVAILKNQSGLLKAVLIYKEAARDQAQKPAGNPLRLKKVPIPVPANNTGEYKLITMKSLKNIAQLVFQALRGSSFSTYSYTNSCMCMCCCCC
jgi:hypothetical protein